MPESWGQRQRRYISKQKKDAQHLRDQQRSALSGWTWKKALLVVIVVVTVVLVFHLHM